MLEQPDAQLCSLGRQDEHQDGAKQRGQKRIADRRHHDAVGIEATAKYRDGQYASGRGMVALIQTTIGTILGPVVAELAASRQTVERRAERVAELKRENGRLRTENAALEARTAPQTSGIIFRSKCKKKSSTNN